MGDKITLTRYVALHCGKICAFVVNELKLKFRAKINE